MMQNAWANPIGTTYKYKYPCTAPSCAGQNAPADAGGNPLSPEQQPEFALDGNGLPVVDYMGDGHITTCPGPSAGPSPTAGYTPYQLANCIDPYTLVPMNTGEAMIRYLPANKYTVEPVPPPGPCGSSDDSCGCADMSLTATIEGTRGNDAWVRASEPRYNVALGQMDWLAAFGLVHSPMSSLAGLPNPGGSTGAITGQVVYVHDMHPPLSPGLSPGLPVKNAYVGLNNLSGNDEQVYTAPCNPETGEFSINGVPPGTYQLVMWDYDINAIIDFRTITVAAGQTVALGPTPVYGWFCNVIGKVFHDVNQNGMPNPTETQGLGNIPVNLRFTDGSLFQTTLTDPTGEYTFSQYFPWWRYLVAEVDNARFKPTGITSVIDNGGPLDSAAALTTYPGTGTTYASMGINPQGAQPGRYRTEPGRVVTEAFNLYQDMTARFDWGKAPYSAGQNGGIHGMMNYATTRTEEDPRNSAIDPWEPGVPNVTARLHQASQFCADDLCSACTAGAPGPASPLNGCWGMVDTGSFPLTTTSDSWNDHLPTGCIGQGSAKWAQPQLVNGFAIPACAETFYHWDQSRPGVFDGAYAFETMPNGTPIPPGNYLVEVVPPAGYEVLKWGDRNIEFGDPKLPFLVQPPVCAGLPYNIPQFHTLFPDQQVPTDTTASGLPPWQPGMQAAACDMKLVALNPGANAIADFNLFTAVPKASRIWGTVWNDLLLEFNPKSPNASGNYGMPWLPVAVKDWKGTEVARFYTDQWGHFDGLVPANYDIAPPIPLGLVLAVYTIAPNDPGPIDTGTGLACNPQIPPVGQCITDPQFNPNYSQDVIRLNWEFYSGRSTFIDTIVLPTGGFQGNRLPVNCDYVNHYPEIEQVSEVILPAGGGPITITSKGVIPVVNPVYDFRQPTGPNNQPTVYWDHGFGPSTPNSKVTVGGTPIVVGNWTDAAITATVPAGVEGQLVVTRGDNGLSTTVGVTIHRQKPGVHVIDVYPPAADCQGTACGVIQTAIDNAVSGDIILIHPGTNYQENLNLYKPVTLQGFGAAVTVLDGTMALGNFPLKQQQVNQLTTLAANGTIGVVPGQASDFTLEQGAGILVAGCDPAACGAGNDFSATGVEASIDGLTISGATFGGGILVNGYANNLKITNNEIINNQGSIGGGIRVGESLMATSFNPNLTIDHNRIQKNGSLFSGGGIALYAGADHYQVTDNMVCGNFSAQYGGGIGHYGLSSPGLIQGNYIVSNESFDEGGGVHIAGEIPTAATALSPGSGSVVVNANLIQGNKGGDDGGGIRTLKVNGQEVANNPANTPPANPGDPPAWYRIDIFNNMVVNNSSADSGGGMAFDDTVLLTVIGNTVARNDSTATSSDAFGGPCTETSPVSAYCPQPEAIGGLTTSNPQVAGIASFAHSTPLLGALLASDLCTGTPADPSCAQYSNPLLVDDIVWQNRSFYWDAAAAGGLGALRPRPGGGGSYWDLGVSGAGNPAPTMSPTYCMLTDGVGATPGGTGNQIGVNPRLTIPYFNIYQATSKGAALGNFVVATFAPNGILGDYHVQNGSPARNAGSADLYPPLGSTDYDGDARSGRFDIGADERPTPHTWPQ